MKKTLSIIGILLLTGFSFFYTEKATQIIRKNDPIMMKLNEVKNNNYVQTIKPIINNDEYITGINGCKIDINKSYDKMKTTRQYNEDLIVMEEVKVRENLNNKYIVGGNKLQKNVSIVFIINNDINDNLINFIERKNIKTNFFVDLDYLNKNTTLMKFISKNNNFYYLGNNKKYTDEYMTYANNLIEVNTNNKSNYCFLENKDENILKLCSKYNMKTIKSDIIKDDLINNIKENLSNGKIIVINSDDIDKIKVSINYILSKGYNIVSLDKLLNEKNNCNN